LRQAVVNRVRDELRRKGRTPAMVDAAELNLEGRDSPLEAAIGTEAFERYQAALSRLRPEEREAIIARVEMDYSYADLAEILGKPTADAARKAAQRALLRLAEEMKA
jgi:RNA polymerase sigma factor (sigma-70 family)